jgi:hypothetical protein
MTPRNKVEGLVSFLGSWRFDSSQAHKYLRVGRFRRSQWLRNRG